MRMNHLGGRGKLQTTNRQFLFPISCTSSAEVNASLSVGTMVSSNPDFKKKLRTPATRHGTLGGDAAVIALGTVNGSIESKGK